jgi:L-ribulose-5-phosphate 3-epimerase
MKIKHRDIGVCSWSLRPADMGELLGHLRSLGLTHVQLALADLLSTDDARRATELTLLRESGVDVTATMISYPGEDYSTIAHIRRTGGLVPDELWPARRDLTIAAGGLARELGCQVLTTHIGFIPPPNDASYPVICKRLSEVLTSLGELGITLLMETGQEPASELLQFLNDLHAKNLGVNFDPANMILYGAGDPIDAIKTLGKHIKHVHVKDAVRSNMPGVEWGEEVAFGDGEVPHAQFLLALDSIGYTGPLVIEREAGDDRVEDVRYAIETLAEL